MKSLTFVIAIMLCISCNKQSTSSSQFRNPAAEYVGIYNSINGDSVWVSTVDDNYVKIIWSADPSIKIMFDSVKVNTDLTFTDNETVEYFGLNHSIGSGKFVNNKLDFSFTLLPSNGDVIFSGIKP